MSIPSRYSYGMIRFVWGIGKRSMQVWEKRSGQIVSDKDVLPAKQSIPLTRAMASRTTTRTMAMTRIPMTMGGLVAATVKIRTKIKLRTCLQFICWKGSKVSDSDRNKKRKKMIFPVNSLSKSGSAYWRSISKLRASYFCQNCVNVSCILCIIYIKHLCSSHPLWKFF